MLECAAEAYQLVCVHVSAAILGIYFQIAAVQVQHSSRRQALAGRRQQQRACSTGICAGEVCGDRAGEHPILGKGAKAWKYGVPHSDW